MIQARTKKPLKAYEDLFEDLMEYTSFTSSEQIQTKRDLYDFFAEVKSDSRKKGRNFRISRFLFERVQQALNIKLKPINRKLKKIIESPKVYKSFEVAKSQEMTATTKDGREVYKSVIVVFRDKSGRIVKDKQIKSALKDLRVKHPDKFVVIRKEPKIKVKAKPKA